MIGGHADKHEVSGRPNGRVRVSRHVQYNAIVTTHTASDRIQTSRALN